MAVQDVSYFYDGYGIAGETGDKIRLEGASTTTIVVSINYDSNTLTLDKTLIWSDRQGVSLDYSGAAPDIGAYEFSTEDVPPAAPTNLRIIL